MRFPLCTNYPTHCVLYYEGGRPVSQEQCVGGAGEEGSESEGNSLSCQRRSSPLLLLLGAERDYKLTKYTGDVEG